MSRQPSTEIWMPLHFAEVNRACGRMNPLAECAYLRLMRDYWLNGPPPNDDDVLASIVRYDAKEWLKVRKLVAAQFVMKSGKWRHGHLDFLRSHASDVSEKRRAARNSGGNSDHT